MPLPVFLYALWALWPFAAYPGGKLFAPLVVLIGVFAVRGVNLRNLSLPVKAGLAFLVWICLTALWSPAGERLFSGNLLDQNFALEASHLRFVFTLIGCFLFVRLIMTAPKETLVKVPVWIYAGIGLHFASVCVMAVMRDHMLASQGDMLVPTGQSMGRNANLLAMGVPLLLGGLAMQERHPRRALGMVCLLGLTSVLVLRLDGLAAILALVLGAGAYVILSYVRKNGFRVLFNLAAFCLLAAPVLVAGLGGLAPTLAGTIPLTAQQRLLIWQATVERIWEQPFFGHGINAASTWTETYASRPDFLDQLAPDLINHRIIPNHPHNMALQIWAETGLAGAGLGALVLFLAGRALPAPERFSVPVKMAGAGVFGAALAYFAVSYSVWDESFWASVAIVLSGVIVLHRKVSS